MNNEERFKELNNIINCKAHEIYDIEQKMDANTRNIAKLDDENTMLFADRKEARKQQNKAIRELESPEFKSLVEQSKRDAIDSLSSLMK